MKKVISFTILILVLAIGFQFVINYLKTEHNVEYSLDIEDKKYYISESYNKISGKDYYFFKVDVDDFTFLLRGNNRFNKQKEVVRNIKSYNKDDLLCISLIYIDDLASSPICSREGKLYSHLTLKSEYDFSEFLTELSNYGFKESENNSLSSTYEDLTVYDKNIDKDETLLVYNYKNIIKINSSGNNKYSFSSFDNYKNELGTLVGNYYMIPKSTEAPSYKFYYAFDVTNDNLKKIELDYDISKQIYINGVYDNKLYLFDKSNLTQYSIDPSNRNIEVTGTKDKKAFFYDLGEEKEINIYELNNSNLKFSNDLGDYKDLEADYIFNFNDYAIVVKDNNFYKVYKDYLNNPILLFKTTSAKEIIAKNEKIYYIQDDYLYRYSEKGIVPLVKREEFKYNYQNIYNIYVDE